ncbi:hypothetical protein FRC19_006241 [Serendipita sp. 401]|nr:hypothetical protein FRC19_006241 [Serendipita sp. 401]
MQLGQTESDRLYKSTVLEALDEQPKGKTSPTTNKIFGSLVEEDCDSSSNYSGNATRKDEESFQGFVWWIDRLQDSEPQNERQADNSQRIEANEEERGPVRGRNNVSLTSIMVETWLADLPSVLMAPECTRKTY